MTRRSDRSYAELAAHYGCLVDPARAYCPADKPRVERPMPYVRDSFWRGREFTSLAQMQAEGGALVGRGRRGVSAVRWSGAVHGPRVFADGRERCACCRCPRTRSCWPPGPGRKIGPDIHARVGKVLYSVPWRRIGHSADVRVTDTMVQFFIGGQLVKTHPRKGWGKQTDFGDYPPEKIAFHMRTPAWCRRQAAGIGPACEPGYRRAARR